MNSLKVFLATTTLMFFGFCQPIFAQQEPASPAVSASAEKKQTVLKEDELVILLVGKKISYQTSTRICQLDVEIDKTVTEYCGPHSDRGKWMIKDSPTGKSKLFCRNYPREGEKCTTVVKDEDGTHYFGLSRSTQSKIIKIEPR